MTTYYLLSESQVLIPAAHRWLQEVSTICVSLSGIRNPLGPQWQPDTTGVVITPLQHIHIAMPHNHGYVALHRDNRGQPACWSLMGLGWGYPIDCVDSVIVSIFLSLHEPSQQTRVAIMSLLRQKDVVTSFWHDNDIIITSCVCWVQWIPLLAGYTLCIASIVLYCINFVSAVPNWSCAWRWRLMR